jgi:hypothetical protein
MKRRKSRFALVGVLALALSVTIGLVSGSVADAKKKKGGGRSFTVSKTASNVVPGQPGPNAVIAKIPIGTVGGKATKGKVISLNGVNATTTFAGSPGFASGVQAEIVGPGGRQAILGNPFGNGSNTEVSSGPLTETPNSSLGVCIPDTPAPPPPCPDPDDVIGPPYIGTIGNEGLLNFSGSGPRGTWFIKVANFNAEPITVGAVTVTGGLILKPAA